MEITIKIFRYDPEKDVRGHYETYVVEGDENDGLRGLQRRGFLCIQSYDDKVALHIAA